MDLRMLRRCWETCCHRLGQLSILRKLLLTGLLVLVPLGSMFGVSALSLSRQIAAVDRETEDVQVLRQLTGLLRHVVHRHELGCPVRARELPSESGDWLQRVTRELEESAAALQRDVSPRRQPLSAIQRAELARMILELPQSPADDRELWRRRHAELIGTLVLRLREFAQSSELLLDDERARLHLTLAAALDLPACAEHLSGLADCLVLEAQSPPVDGERLPLAGQIGRLRRWEEVLELHLASVVAIDDSALPPQVSLLYRRHREAIERLLPRLERLREQAAPPDDQDLSLVAWLAASATGAALDLTDQCVESLQESLAGRARALRNERRLLSAFTAAAACAVALLLGAFGWSFRRSLRRLHAAAAQILAGDLHAATRLDPEHTGELSGVVQEFVRLTARLRLECAQARAEAQRAAAAEERLRSSEQRLELALQTTNDGIYEWNLQSNEIFYSARLAAWLGLAEQDSSSGSWREVQERVHPEDRAALQQAVDRALQQSAPSEAQFRLRCADGEYRWFLSRGVVVRDGDGRPMRIVGAVRDVTEEKRAEQERARYVAELQISRDQIAAQARELAEQTAALRRSKELAEAGARAKDEFLANMSHELRTPLTAIIGYSDVLYEDGDLSQAPASRLDTIDTIRRNGRHLLELINNILDLTKLESGQVAAERLVCRPREVVADAQRLFELRAREKRLSFECRAEQPLPSAFLGDPFRLRQILVNLLGNAFKFTTNGGVVLAVSAQPGPQPSVTFSVADTGIGMRPEELERLFRPFAQADSSMTRRFGGTGLGLSISQRLARLLGGELSVSSEAGVGTTFRLTLPVELPSDAVWETTAPADAAYVVLPPVEPPPRERWLEGASVLVVEDAPPNQKLIAFVLERAGAKVELAENGSVAVASACAAEAAGKPFDLIIMDMQMPVMDGYAATRALRERGYPRPIIALTAHALDGDEQKCLDAGCDAYTTKPIQRAAFLAVCTRWYQARTSAHPRIAPADAAR